MKKAFVVRKQDFTITDRLFVWAFEKVAEAFLILMVVYLLAWPASAGESRWSQWTEFPEYLLLMSIGYVCGFFLPSYYFITTILAGVVWRSRVPWVYASVAAALIFIHFRIFLYLGSNGTAPELKIFGQTGAPLIAFVVAYLGSRSLRPAHSVGPENLVTSPGSTSP